MKYLSLKSFAGNICTVATSLLLASTLTGCVAVGYSSGGGWFFWPGGIVGLLIILAIFFLLRRRR